MKQRDDLPPGILRVFPLADKVHLIDCMEVAERSARERSEGMPYTICYCIGPRGRASATIVIFDTQRNKVIYDRYLEKVGGIS